MASRLSEDSLKAVYDTGHQGLAIRAGDGLDLLSGPAVDLDKLLLAENPEQAIQQVEPQPLFQALMAKGPEDCLEVLRHISTEQLVRIFDYDAWSEDRLSPIKAVRWLNLFKEIGAEELYRRFRDLDEEYQLALVGPLVTMYDEEEYEKLSQPEQDAVHRMPCGTVFYRVNTQDPRIEEFVTSLIEATATCDLNYAYALLAHAAYMPPNEQEAMIGQFRRARLEEDGFVSFEESISFFQLLDLGEIRQRWNFALHREDTELVGASAGEELFLMRVIQAVAREGTSAEFEQATRSLAVLSNALCAAAKVEPDDLHGLRRILQHAQASVSLGLEWLANGDVAVGQAIFAQESAKTLFRTGLSLVGRLMHAAVRQMVRRGLPEATRLERLLATDKRGTALHTLEQSMLDVLGFDRVETLRGLMNRFPVVPISVTADGDGVRRVIFEPVSSLRALSKLAHAVDGIMGQLYLAALAAGADATDPQSEASAKLEASWRIDLDRQLTTALTRVLIGGAFRSDPLNDQELAQVAALSREAVRTVAAEFYAGVEGTLRVALTAGEASWSASQAAGIYVEDPVQAVMADFSDLVMRLTAALGADDESERVRALHGLVHAQNPQQEVM